MASFEKRDGRYTARVKLQGTRDARTFDTRREAADWARDREKEIRDGAAGRFADKTFGQLLEKYRDEVSHSKAGARWETIRLNLLLQDELVGVTLAQLNEAKLGEWRDRRLLQVSAGTVRREMNLLSAALHHARREWKWIPKSPLTDVRRPPRPLARDRLYTKEEVTSILHALGYRDNELPATITSRVGAVFEFCLETAMRQGEACALEWGDVNLAARVARVLRGKTVAARRDVPLSRRAVALIEQVRPLQSAGPLVFKVTTSQVESLFRSKGTVRCGIEGATFHDSRHTAITNLAKKMGVLDLARMVGHADLNQLQTYYNRPAAEIAKELD